MGDKQSTLAELEANRQRLGELEEENRLLRAEVAERDALLALADDVLIVAQDGKLVFHNPAFANMVTHTPDEVASTSFIDFVHSDDRLGLMQAYARAMADHDQAAEYEFRTVTERGIVRWYRIRARAGSWAGKPAMRCSLKELTAEKRTQSKYEHVLEVIPVGVYEMDPRASRLLHVNDAMCRILGYTRGELLALDPLDIVAPEQRAHGLERRERAAQGLPNSPTAEYRVLGKAGREAWVLINSKLMHHDDGSVTTIVVAQDITERKLNEEELRRVDKLESLGVLAGGIAHDFNNLLTAILGNVTIGRRRGEDPRRRDQIFAEVEHACLRASSLTQQLLTFSHGGAPIRRVTAIAPTLRECATLGLRGSNVRCGFDVPADLWSVDVDEGQIGQVVTNLVINAAQAMAGGGEIHLTASNVDLADGERPPLGAGRFVEVKIIDSGVGIAAEHLERIFDPYFTTKQSGSGLGLATAFSIMQRHGGHIAAESTVGEGTMFRLHLPASARAESVAASAGLAPILGSGRVLVMDDEEAVRLLSEAMLATLGYTATVARNGEEAVALFTANLRAGTPFDAVILDLTVGGGMGGIEAIAQLQAIEPTVRGLVMSGYSNDPVLADPLAFGFLGGLSKPFTVDAMGAALASIFSAAVD